MLVSAALYFLEFRFVPWPDRVRGVSSLRRSLALLVIPWPGKYLRHPLLVYYRCVAGASVVLVAPRLNTMTNSRCLSQLPRHNQKWKQATFRGPTTLHARSSHKPLFARVRGPQRCLQVATYPSSICSSSLRVIPNTPLRLPAFIWLFAPVPIIVVFYPSNRSNR